MADWEDLYDSHKENLEIHEMECEMFGQPLDNDELANELDDMVALDAAKELGELEPMPIIGIEEPADKVSDSEEQVEAEKPKRKLVAA